MARCVPPETHRERIATYFDPLPFWYMPFEEARIDRDDLPAARADPAADADVSFLALAERLAAADPRQQPAVRQPRASAGRWALPRRIGSGCRVTTAGSSAPTRLMDGVNRGHGVDLERDRQARRGLEPRSAARRNSARRFLLNHLISELLPADGGYDHANADPITGQAAWYDLRVRIDRGRSRTKPA